MTLVCEPDQSYAGRLAAELGGGVRVVASLAAAARAITDDADPVLVIGPGVALEPVLTFGVRIQLSRPRIQLVLIRTEPTEQVVEAAHSVGIREVVAAGNIDRVVDAIRLAEAQQPRRGPAGRIVTVFSAKGGCGKTTLATNLAAALHGEGGGRVCLLDLDLTFGDVASTLALQPVRSLVDAAGLDHALTADDVPILLTPFRPGLDCVLAPAGPGDATKVPAGLVADLLAILPSRYDHIVVDTPAQFSAHVLAALDASHQHILMTTPERPALKNLRLTLDMLDLLGYPQHNRAIVINRSDSRVGLTPAEVEALVRNPIAGHLPSRGDVAASINRGVPLVMTDPNHVVSQAVRRLAANRVTPKPAAPVADQNNWGWW